MPWAFDSDGTRVPTWYTFADDILTLHIDHTGGEYVYPIVADPCWKFWSSGCRRPIAQAATQGLIAGRIYAIASVVATVVSGGSASPSMAIAATATVYSVFISVVGCMAFCDPEDDE